MNLVDVHSHLNHKQFQDRLDSVIDNARKAGLKAIIVAGVNVPTNREVLQMAAKYPDIVKCSLGIYPIDALNIEIPALDEVGLTRNPEPFDVDKELAFIKTQKDKIIAIGEVGMDFKYLREHEKKQRENFQKVIDFAEKIKKPVVVHSRRAEVECVEMLESSKLKNVVLHCFEGKKSLIKKAEDLGYCFSIPAIAKRLQHFQTVTEMVSITQLLTETDSPWLSPELGRFSEPADVKGTVELMAKIKGMTFEETANNIFMNFQRLFF